MSSHPFGPWSETTDSSGTAYPGNWRQYISQYNYTNDTATGWGLMTGEKKTRTGFNSMSRPFIQVTPASLTRYYCAKFVPGSMAFAYQDSTGHYNSDVVTNQSPPQHSGPAFLVMESSLDKAKLKLTTQAAGLFKGGIFTGEFKETKQMLGHVASGLTTHHNEVTQKLSKTLLAMRHANLKTVVRTIADARLEWNFGVKPFLSDMQSLGTSLSVYQHGGIKKPITVKASYSTNAVGTFRNDSTNSYNTGFVSAKASTSVNHTSIAKVGATYKASAPSVVSDVKTIFGLTPNEIVPTTWELIPCSWLADYLTNCNSILQALSNTHGLLESCWYVTLDESIATTTEDSAVISSSFPTTYINLGLSSKPAVVEMRSFSFNRGSWDSDTFVPSFSIRYPSLEQGGNILAFAAQRLLPSPPLNRVFDARFRGKVNQFFAKPSTYFYL